MTGVTVFELTPTGGSWNYSVLYSIFGNSGAPRSRVVIDAAGNLYGAFIANSTLFKLSPSGGGWRYTDLHDFSGNDGVWPQGNLVIDSQGRIYGTCSEAGQDLYGTAWEFTP